MLEDHGTMGCLVGYKYEGGYRVWIPRIDYLYEGTVPVLPDHGPSPRSNATRQGPSCTFDKNSTWTHNTSTDTSTTGRIRRP